MNTLAKTTDKMRQAVSEHAACPLDDGREISVPSEVPWLNGWSQAKPKQRATGRLNPAASPFIWPEHGRWIEICRLLDLQPIRERGGGGNCKTSSPKSSTNTILGEEIYRKKQILADGNESMKF